MVIFGKFTELFCGIGVNILKVNKKSFSPTDKIYCGGGIVTGDAAVCFALFTGKGVFPRCLGRLAGDAFFEPRKDGSGFRDFVPC